MSMILNKEIYDRVRNNYNPNDCNLNNIGDIIFVHRTDYPPIDNKIMTARSGGQIQKLNYKKGFGFFNTSYEDYMMNNPRNNIFFTLNCIVGAHSYGDFSPKKIAVLINGDSLDLSKVRYANPVDFAVEGMFC